MSSAAAVFRALADPTRRQILQELRDCERSAGDISATFDIAAPSVSRHLAILSAAGLISPRRDGNRIYYRLEADPLVRSLNELMSAVCPTQVVARRRISLRRTREAKP